MTSSVAAQIRFRPGPRIAALLAAVALLAAPALAQARTTIACHPYAKSAPRTCLVFSLPGAVTRQHRLSLSRLRWENWGSRRATGSGRLLIGRVRVRVRLVADQRQPGLETGDTFYTRLTVIDRAGNRQSLGLDVHSESS